MADGSCQDRQTPHFAFGMRERVNCFQTHSTVTMMTSGRFHFRPTIDELFPDQQTGMFAFGMWGPGTLSGKVVTAAGSDLSHIHPTASESFQDQMIAAFASGTCRPVNLRRYCGLL
jgi:hypothetical protein